MSKGYENITLLLLNHKQPDKAISVLNEARRRFPDQPGFSYYLAVALERAKQHQQALSVFEQTEVEAQSEKPSMLSGEFYFEFGATAEQAGLYDRAAQLMKKSLVLEDDPRKIANTSNYLGYMWVDHNLNVEEGGDLIKRALEVDPDNGAYLDSLGWYYYRTNQFDQATAQLTKAVQKTEPEDPTVYEHLGDAYWKQNDVAKAVGCWQKAIDLDPKSPDVPELSKKIAASKAPRAGGSRADAKRLNRSWARQPSPTCSRMKRALSRAASGRLSRAIFCIHSRQILASSANAACTVSAMRAGVSASAPA